MEDIDDTIVPDAPSTLEPTDNPITPHRVFSRPNPDLGAARHPIGVFNGSLVSPIRKAASMGDPRFAYPSPESALRLPLGPQRSLYYTPPPSPTGDAGHSNDVLMEDEDEQSMDIDDVSLTLLDPRPSEDLQQTIRNLQQSIETLNVELNGVKASRQMLENTIDALRRRASESKTVRDSLQSRISELQIEMVDMTTLNQRLHDKVLKYQDKLKAVTAICAE
ncbi:hypothetical protein BDZ94DRAFT_894874 [Collybia nuda]|uniref:Uncharacterized protein n=1 Tax=Collybia nuda TaxID=64659 RepID=A0A9P5Y1C1_9AGAR|nr:hypothetical protein BDZ94DRAFT_894874 [Collybia nuda]